jgi:hypothetical protein
LLVDQFHFDIISGIFSVHENDEWNLICIVVKVDEPIVQEEAGVALFAIAIIDLIASLNVVTCLNDESLSLVAIIPGGLPWSFVIQHISVWYKTISFNSIDCNTENSAGNHHPYFRILLYGELGKIWHFSAYQIVICFNIFNFFVDLVQKWTSG